MTKRKKLTQGRGCERQDDDSDRLPERRHTEQTYCRWRNEFGGLQVDQARLKELEHENAKPKWLASELAWRR
jgi:hypothetical protein